MPYSVKISDLPVRTNVVATDMVPVVDAAETQTSTVTAAQIAALGGGRPGDDSIETACLKAGSVTYPKIQTVTANTLLGRGNTGNGQVGEISCSAFMQGVLGAANSAAACTAMGALASTVDSTFTGQVKLADGTQSAPSLTNTGNLNTGLFFPTQTIGSDKIRFGVGLTTDGFERMRIGIDGTQFSNFPGTDISQELREQYVCRAWVIFNGFVAGGGTTSIVANQNAVAARYGLKGSILDDATTKTYMTTQESTNNSLTLAFPTTPTFADAYGKGTFPRYNLGTETRANYTTPGNNSHWKWNGSAWVSVAATTGPWIGTINLTSAANTPVVSGGGNIASVTRTAAGAYDVNFSAAMPDANYCVVGSCTANGGTQAVFRVVSMTTTKCSIAVATGTTTLTGFDSSLISVAVFR